jgi:hypothetical protein
MAILYGKELMAEMSDLKKWEDSLNISAHPYNWVDNQDRTDLIEIIDVGNAIFFQFNNQDYFIEGGANGYLIQDPMIGHPELSYRSYPENEKFKTANELLAAPFLDGKTILERFDSGELKFFD